MTKRLFLLLLSCFVVGCTSLKVTQLDPNTGRFPTKEKATVVKSEKVDLDSLKSVLLISDNYFIKGQLENIHYFGKIITFSDLQNIIVQKELTDEVPSIEDRIGIHKAYEAYKPFLWFHVDSQMIDGQKYAQFILTDPDKLKDIFVVQQKLDYVWKGVHDQNVWYPMFNALIDYIEANSKVYKNKNN